MDIKYEEDITAEAEKKIHIRRITKSPACSMAPEIDHISF